MDNKTVTLGKKGTKVPVTGRFRLTVNRDPQKFRMTNIQSFVPFGRDIKDKVSFRTKSGAVDFLFIDKIQIFFDPDRSELDAHNVAVLIQHPDVRLLSMKPEEHDALYRENLKKPNPTFSLVNIDKIETESHEEAVDLLLIKAKLYSKENALTKETLIYLAAALGLSYRSEIQDEKRYKIFLQKQIAGALEARGDEGERNQATFNEILDNKKRAELIYYLAELKRLQVVVDYAGIFKVDGRPVGSSEEDVMKFFSMNPDIFESLKMQVVSANQNTILS